MKYKVGDRVRIVSERVRKMNTSGEMDCWLGKIMTISTITGYDRTYPYRMAEDGGEWMWNDDMIAGLAEPVLTAEKLLQVVSEICNASICNTCPINYRDEKAKDEPCHLSIVGKRSAKIIEICQQWKADHEKKPPEIETVDICRIEKILPDGSECRVYEEDIKPDSVLQHGSERLAAESILQRYCMEHEGVYRAVHEVVSRVKAVN